MELNLKKMGYHLKQDWGKSPDFAKLTNLGLGIIQVFTGVPTRMDRTSHEALTQWQRIMDNPDRECVFHAPYLTCFHNPKSLMYKRTVDFCQHLIQFSVGKSRTVEVVAHPGKPGDSANISRGLRECLGELSYYARTQPGCNFKLLLETDATPNRELSLSELQKRVAEVKGAWGQDILGTCFDTEHAFASGHCEFLEIPTNDLRIDLVHLNAIPSFVRRGSGLDRHGDTLLEESQVLLGYPRAFVTECTKQGIPMVMEVRECEMILRNIQYLKNL